VTYVEMLAMRRSLLFAIDVMMVLSICKIFFFPFFFKLELNRSSCLMLYHDDLVAPLV
jgi:hypothetical protein